MKTVTNHIARIDFGRLLNSTTKLLAIALAGGLSTATFAQEATIIPQTIVWAGVGVRADSTPYELGTIFRSSVPGRITRLRAYGVPGESGDHIARIWRNKDNTVIGGPYTWNYTGNFSWVDLTIPELAIEANTDYTVSISTGTDAGMAYPQIEGATAIAGGGQYLAYPAGAGVFTTTIGAQPTITYGKSHLRDVIFVPITSAETVFAESRTALAVPAGSPVELGTIFQSSVPGRITHLRVYGVAGESGDHIARVWRNSDDTVIAGPFTWNYTGSNNWIDLAIPDLAIEANTEYTVCISTGTDAGSYFPRIESDTVAGGGNGRHLTYPVNAGTFTGNLGARPTDTYNYGNYFRDVVFLPDSSETISPASKTGAAAAESIAYEFGTIFQSSVPGRITHVRVYGVAGESGDHIARIWRNSDDTVIAGPFTWNFTGTNGWMELAIPDVDIEANTEYTVSVSTGTDAEKYYASWTDMSVSGDNGRHLSYPANAGTYTSTLNTRPTLGFGNNYLRDVVFTASETISSPSRTGAAVPSTTFLELGTMFRATAFGRITHLRVYGVEGESGDHTARIWRNSDDAVIAGPFTWNYTGANSWIDLDIPDLKIDPNTDYTVSISTGTDAGNYFPRIEADTMLGGGNGQHLIYVPDGGTYSTTPGERPLGTYNHGNYLRDIVFVADQVEPVTGTNASLTSLVLNPSGLVGLTSAFESNTFSYTATNAYGITPTVTVINADTAATNCLIYDGVTNLLSSGVASSSPVLALTLGATNVVMVQVTAQDGVTVQTYTVNMIEHPNLAGQPMLTNSLSSQGLNLSWGADRLGYRLIMQTNRLGQGVSRDPVDWGTVPGSTAITSTNFPAVKDDLNGYFRLVYP